MKATIANLKKALKACAKAHNVEYKSWPADGQIGIHSETVPVVADVKMIIEAFYGDFARNELVETGYGYTTVFLYDTMNTKNDVDETLLKLALPAGTVL